MCADLLIGSNYRALQRLSDGHDVTLAEVGETCERVPVESLSWLHATGAIAPLLSLDLRPDLWTEDH